MDDLGDRLKAYEQQETARKLIPGIPIYARIDGRSFSRFSRDMNRPFDPRMTAAMIDSTKYLVDKSEATIGYTQSDEISLAWANVDHNAEPWFGGKIHKLTSVLASMATIAFVEGIMHNFPDWQAYLHRMPHFDCRVFQVPNLDELANCMLWRNLDATKNAISMAAHHHFGHNELQGKNSAQKQEMLWQTHGINFNDYPASFKRGTFVRKTTVQRTLSAQELGDIPPQHRPSGHALVTRNQVIDFDLPPLGKIANRKDVLFFGAQPQTQEQS
jgi:tRNA(His) 5'-end guanylyltransferase